MDRRPRRSRDSVHVFPADRGQRPLVAVGRVGRATHHGADLVERCARDACVVAVRDLRGVDLVSRNADEVQTKRGDRARLGATVTRDGVGGVGGGESGDETDEECFDGATGAAAGAVVVVVDGAVVVVGGAVVVVGGAVGWLAAPVGGRGRRSASCRRAVASCRPAPWCRSSSCPWSRRTQPGPETPQPPARRPRVRSPTGGTASRVAAFGACSRAREDVPKTCLPEEVDHARCPFAKEPLVPSCEMGRSHH